MTTRKAKRTDTKPIGGLGPGVGPSVKQVVMARLMKKSKEKKNGNCK